MTVVFQEKIIYMPYMPPFARSEKIADYAASCRPVEWREEKIRSIDGTGISLCVGKLPDTHGIPAQKQVCTMIALSYRGYWKSAGKASQRGIELDAQAMLDFVASAYPHAMLVLWGQSIGAGIASTAAAHHIERSIAPPIAGLIMETPFMSIETMLFALYPQKWLPYRYLSPFLRSHWDSGVALRRIAEAGKQPPRVLLMPATRDEVVPPEEIEALEQRCKDLSLEYDRKNVLGALHTEATSRREGQQAVAEFVRKLAAP
ncbi:hypothetical protein LTR15_007977 [Elasticomyces elasticus]|nr:hypothetical protein LTR15_007977 [Elasticomyces elasticus]